LQLVSEVFQGGLEALASRQGAKADQLQTISRVRAALFEVLETSPMGKDPVATMKLCAVIAAGFEDATREFDRNRADYPQGTECAPRHHKSSGQPQTTA
jgi:hypothetical protein